MFRENFEGMKFKRLYTTYNTLEDAKIFWEDDFQTLKSGVIISMFKDQLLMNILDSGDSDLKKAENDICSNMKSISGYCFASMIIDFWLENFVEKRSVDISEILDSKYWNPVNIDIQKLLERAIGYTVQTEGTEGTLAFKLKELFFEHFIVEFAKCNLNKKLKG